jgi:hypothetical protein
MRARGTLVGTLAGLMKPEHTQLEVNELELLQVVWSWREESNLQPAVYKTGDGGLLKSLTTWAVPHSMRVSAIMAYGSPCLYL